MRTLFGCLALVIAGPALGADPDSDRVPRQFVSDDYTVTWSAARAFDPDAALEIGHGSGHGFTLGWLRFQPGKDGVDVLSIRLVGDRKPYESKWPPDRAPVTVKHARMKPDAYAALLSDLAVVDSAKLEPVKKNSFSSSSNDFWVYARLTGNKKMLLDLNWAGYDGSLHAVDLAKPRAAVALAQEAIEGLDFKEHELTKKERGWASEKFARDWSKFKDLESHWWVRERYVITIGVVGDAAALPTLREVLGGDPKDHCVYYAVNAVTRLTRKDVRDAPVEEMDVEKTRRKVLDLLREGK
jgi:hypothetical protein